MTNRIGSRGAFTLIEVLLVCAIVAVALGIVTLAFRKLGESNRLSVAAGTLTQFAAVARAYAIENGIETMLVVNNVNGRMEIWHANPNVAGGGWDPLSGGFAANGYVFAPILESSAAMPIGTDNRPLVVVHPLDFDAVVDATGTRLRDTAATQENYDNLMWPAVCFAPDGRLVQVVRRIATRLPTDFTGAAAATPNRRTDGSLVPYIPPPPAPQVPQPSFVNPTDSRVTSTRGFIVSDRRKAEEVLVTPFPTPADIVNVWLARTRSFPEFVRNVVISPWSGRELATIQ